MSRSIYELTTDAIGLMDLLENGDITEEALTEALNFMGADTKVENLCKMKMNFEREIEGLDAEIKRLTDKKKARQNSVDWIKQGLLGFVSALPNSKYKSDLFSVSVGHTKAVQITYECLIPKKFLIDQAPKIDKAGIKEALLNGEKVSGCELVTNSHVTIR